MKVKIEGYDVEGSADEIVTLVKKLGKKTEPKLYIDDNYAEEQKVIIPKRKRNNIDDIKSRFPYAMEWYKKGYNISKSLTKAGIKKPCGQYYAMFKKFLKQNNVPIILGNRKKRKTSLTKLSIENKELLNNVMVYYNKGFSIKKSFRKVGRKNIGGTEYNLFRNFLKENVQPIVEQKKVIVKDKPEDNRSKRMKFISTRTAWYMKVMKMTRQKAMTMAADEWNTPKQKQNGAVKQIPIPDAPRIMGNETTNNLLMDILRSMIANDSKMTMFNEGKILGIETREEWIGLLNILVRKSDHICNYFNVTNGSFKILLNGNIQMLTFNRG